MKKLVGVLLSIVLLLSVGCTFSTDDFVAYQNDGAKFPTEFPTPEVEPPSDDETPNTPEDVPPSDDETPNTPEDVPPSDNPTNKEENSSEESTPILPEKGEDASPTSFIHLSFDDTTACFQNLAANHYDSLFDEPFFAQLNSLHDTYGAIFSFYTYTNVLINVPNTYANEFSSHSDWLKIGFHSDKSGHNLSGITYQDGLAYWNEFIAQAIRICGTENSIDRVPRLEFFSGSQQGLLGMRDGNLGARGFLSADDSRYSYYFTAETAAYLYDNDRWQDTETGLTFFATDIRGDWWYNFSTANTYKIPVKESVEEELSYRATSLDFASSSSSYIVFTHEWLVYNGKTVNAKMACIEGACKFAQTASVAFAYPQDKIA